MKKIEAFLIGVLALLILLSASDAFGQNPTRLRRPCAATSTPATVELQRDGDIDLVPCSGRSVLIAGSSIQTSALPSQTGNAGKALTTNGTTASWTALPIEIAVAASDETSAITTGTAKVTFHAIRAFTLQSVYVGLSAVSTSGVVTIDINKNGVSIFSTVITIDANEETSLTAATAAVITTTSFAQGDKITVDFDTAGTNAKGVKVYMLGTR